MRLSFDGQFWLQSAGGMLCLLVAAGCQSAPTPLDVASRVIRPVAFFQDAKQDRRRAWDAWGRQHLQSGDLVFVMGESRILLGLLNFSKFSAEIAESPFSHVGVVAVEEEGPVVYDIISEGALRRPFADYVTDRRVWSFAVRRLHPARQASIPAALAFCRRVYEEQGEFDNAFRSDNDRYYCAELVEMAFREAGQPLSEPIRLNALPGYEKLSPATIALVQATTSITPDQEVFLPGNERYGIWSCPWLDTVLDKTDAESLPPQAPASLARLPGTAPPAW